MYTIRMREMSFATEHVSRFTVRQMYIRRNAERTVKQLLVISGTSILDRHPPLPEQSQGGDGIADKKKILKNNWATVHTI